MFKLEIGRCFEEGDPESYLCGDREGGYFTRVVSVSLTGKLTSERCVGHKELLKSMSQGVLSRQGNLQAHSLGQERVLLVQGRVRGHCGWSREHVKCRLMSRP